MSDEELFNKLKDHHPNGLLAINRIRELEAELERQRALGADIAMGRKVIVPVEATEAMIDAFYDEIGGSGWAPLAAKVAACCRAMIRAAHEQADE